MLGELIGKQIKSEKDKPTGQPALRRSLLINHGEVRPRGLITGAVLANYNPDKGYYESIEDLWGSRDTWSESDAIQINNFANEHEWWEGAQARLDQQIQQFEEENK